MMNLPDELRKEAVSSWKGVMKDAFSVQSFLLRRAKISRPAYFMMNYVDSHGPQQQADLADILEVSRPTITSLVDNLEQEGLVERERSDEDRRSVLVQLTPTGKRKIRHTGMIYDQIVNSVLEQLELSQVQVLLSVFNTMKLQLRKISEKISMEL